MVNCSTGSIAAGRQTYDGHPCIQTSSSTYRYGHYERIAFACSYGVTDASAAMHAHTVCVRRWAGKPTSQDCGWKLMHSRVGICRRAPVNSSHTRQSQSALPVWVCVVSGGWACLKNLICREPQRPDTAILPERCAKTRVWPCLAGRFATAKPCLAVSGLVFAGKMDARVISSRVLGAPRCRPASCTEPRMF